jgi:hypothetical protein
MFIGLHVKYLLLVSDFLENGIFPDIFSNDIEI